MDAVVIGIAGGTGSGKTTVAESIGSRFCPDRVVLVGQDAYYLDAGHLPIEERAKINYDHPSAFDNALLAHHVEELKAGRPIERPVYNFASHSRLPDTVHVKPGKVIILEGILVLEDSRLRDLMDIRIFVDVDADVRFIRRLQRDMVERGRSLKSVVDQYMNVVRKMHLGFVEPSKRHAHVIIAHGGHNEVAIDMVASKVRSILDAEETTAQAESRRADQTHNVNVFD